MRSSRSAWTARTPARHPLRMVSVLWQGAWYRYLTNVLDLQTLTARQVCELYLAALAD